MITKYFAEKMCAINMIVENTKKKYICKDFLVLLKFKIIDSNEWSLEWFEIVEVDYYTKDKQKR